MRAKNRINITIDDETTRLMDHLARRRKTSRSAVLREGVKALAAADQREAEDAARRRGQQEAVKAMDRLARLAGDWPAEKILRAWRDRHARGRQ